MNRTIILTALTAPLLFAACDGAGGGWEDIFGDDTGYYDTGFNGDTAPLITQIDYGCDVGNPDQWWFDVTNEGWAGDVTVDLFETGDGAWGSGNVGAVWDERHYMTNVEWAEDGSWDRWDLTLSDVESPGSQTAGRSTLFGCAWNDGRSLAFMATAYDDNGRFADCAIWGHESEQYFNGYLNNDCICFENDGNCSN